MRQGFREGGEPMGPGHSPVYTDSNIIWKKQGGKPWKKGPPRPCSLAVAQVHQDRNMFQKEAGRISITTQPFAQVFT